MIKNPIKFIYLWLMLLLFSYQGFAQQALTGSITDQKGKPIAEAIVSVKNQSGNEVYSDQDGKFSINAKLGDVLKITAGPVESEVNVTKDALQITITPKNEIISLGYGITRTKDEITAATGTVQADEIAKRLTINPANALFGKIPGLAVLQNGGTSWENDPRMILRGIGTLRDNSLLVLVDGYERPISSLSIGEIENITVLKDAAALALYGQRGANGILLVTTKRGDASKNKVEIDYEHGITQAFRLPKFLDSYNYAQALNQARSNDGLAPLYDQQALNAFQSGSSPYLYPNVNWFNQALRDFGQTNNLKASFQGQSPSTSYFALINYQNDEGLLGPVNENDSYTTQLNYGKFNFRSNVDINITATTKFKVGLSGNIRETRTPGTSVNDMMWALYNTPAAAYPVKTENGIWGGTSRYNNNAYAQIASSGYRVNQVRELLADGSLQQDLGILLPGLSAEAALAYDNSAIYAEGKTKQYQYQSLALVDNGNGEQEVVTTNYGNNTELQYYSNLANQWRHATALGKINYKKKWGNHNLNSVLLFQHDKLVRNGQSNTFIHEVIAANVHYSNSQKYFADFSLAYSGNNILPDGDRFGWFPALSVGWKISNEEWFSNKNFFNDLKVRASWGLTGNDLIPQNLSAAQYNGSTPYFFTPNNNISGGLQEGRLPSTNLTYEQSAKYNVGIDATLLNMLDVNVDVFYDRRSNILVESDGLISNILGANKPLLGEGIVDNKGLELGLTFYNNKNAFKYYVNGQLAYVKNKVIKMGEAYQPFSYLSRTGQAIGQAFGLEAVGFFKNQLDIDNSPKQTFSIVKPGDVKYKDQNQDGVINSYDEKPIGYNTVNPEIYYAASLGLEYKGFGLDATFQGLANKTLYIGVQSTFWPLIGNSNISTFSNNSWTPTTAETATLPRLTTLGNDNNYRPNSIWLKDGSYLKLRSLTLHYDLPQQVISKLKLSKTRIILRGMDLFSIDNIKDVDPESIGFSYPTYSTYSLGLQIGF